MRQASSTQAAKERVLQERVQRLAREKDWPLVIATRNGGVAALVDVDGLGNPVYLSTDNNIRAAATIGTNQLWPGGATGLNLSGSTSTLTNRVGLWDGGTVRETHVELTGRIDNKNTGTQSDHSTHVAGTIMATGVNALAKGMAYQLPKLLVYDFTNHLSEMMDNASTLLISNHSYGTIAGWYYNDASSRWEFYGPPNSTEDFKFGYYSSEAEVWDSIAYNAPQYLIVKSAGNNRNQNGPAVGEPFWRYNSSNVMTRVTSRPSNISDNDSYDIIATYGTAKNILTVGAVNPLAAGYTKASDVVLADFSSWGPTDDGRIKPDVVANGVDVLSSVASGNSAYATYSGTSMATPSASGSLVLLQEYYARLHSGSFMRSATLKGIIIHTADEAGPADGPDYQHGWGLINMQKAAAVITADNAASRTQRIEERVLDNGDSYTLNVTASGNGPLVATICWTDPKAVAITGQPLDDNTKRLINDLDIRISDGTNTFMPWILRPEMPSAAAIHGDNELDNVEKIEIPDAVPGVSYTITVSHKNTLARGSQAFSLILSGIGGISYCASGATQEAGTRIDSVSFGTLTQKNPDGCTQYTDYTSLTGLIEPNSTQPIFIRLNNCDGSSAARTVKVFIDYNNDGDFTDANELVLTQAVASGAQSFTANITIPAGLSINNYTRMRIVAVETSNAAAVTPCGTYTRGETQDYRLRITSPANDVGVTSISNPLSGSCATAEQYVTVRVRNFGSTTQSNIPLNLTVTNGSNTVLNINSTYPGTLAGQSEVDYTFQTAFATVAGTTYTITSSSSLPSDQQATNNQASSSLVVASASAAPAGQAELCSNTVFFSATNFAEGDVPYWYETASSTTPIAAGTVNSSTVITSNGKYYLAKNLNNSSVGPKTRSSLGSGQFRNLNGHFLTFTNGVPVVIESARLYIQGTTPGKLTITVARNLNFPSGATSYSYTPVSSTEIDAYATSATEGAVFLLNLTVPTVGDHILIISRSDGSNATLFRNEGLTTSPYPMGINGVFRITGNVQSYIDNTAAQYYQVFYDLKIRTANCPSGAARTEVTAGTATAPVITQNGNILSSNRATGNQWYRDNNPIASATGQTYTANVAGVYKVIATDDFGCALTSNEIAYGVTSTPNVDPQEIGLKVYPNPNNGQFFTDFTVNTRADLSITILSAVGQKVFENVYAGFTGRFNKTIQAGPLPQGVYLLRIQHDNKSYLKKLFIK